MSFTVVPLHNMNLSLDSPIAFGAGFMLTSVPAWLREDEFMVNRLSARERDFILAAKHALVAEYEASAIGEPDPTEIRSSVSIQDSKSEAAMLGNLALWLIRPTTVCFTTVFHALTKSISGIRHEPPIILRTETRQPLLVHPSDLLNTISTAEAVQAGALHATLTSIPRGTTVWSAARSFWGALTVGSEDVRFSLFWIGLEALLGPEGNTGEVAYKLAQRIAFLTSKDSEQAKATFRNAKECYSTRSKIVHGRWTSGKNMLAHTANTETIGRNVLLRILTDPALLREFLCNKRDTYLEEMVFSGFSK